MCISWYIFTWEYWCLMVGGTSVLFPLAMRKHVRKDCEVGRPLCLSSASKLRRIGVALAKLWS